jgi:hypothetical protein
VSARQKKPMRSRLKSGLITGICSGSIEMRRFRSVVPIHDVIGWKREVLVIEARSSK